MGATRLRKRPARTLPSSPTSITVDEPSWSIAELSLDASCLEPTSVMHDPSYRPELEALWEAAFPGSTFEVNSTQWLRLGFQTADPSKDVRAAGVTGLRQCVHFCQSSGQEALLHVQQSTQAEAARGAEFPLATASFNVSLMLLQYLGLCSTSGGAGAVARCPDQTLRSCVRLQRSLPWNVSLLDLMHEHLLRWLWDRWSELSSSSERTTMLFQFPGLLRATVQHMQRSLSQLPAAWTLPAVLLALRDGVLERSRARLCLPACVSLQTFCGQPREHRAHTL